MNRSPSQIAADRPSRGAHGTAQGLNHGLTADQTSATRVAETCRGYRSGGAIVLMPRSRIARCAAAIRATGTRNGEHDT